MKSLLVRLTCNLERTRYRSINIQGKVKGNGWPVCYAAGSFWKHKKLFLFRKR